MVALRALSFGKQQQMQVATSVPATRSKTTRQLGRRIGIAALALVLSVVTVVPFYFMGRDGKPGGMLWMPVTHDMGLHLEQMKSFYNGLAAGAIYPRWEEDTNRGFGAPTPSYYPPAIYYLTSAFYAATRDWMWTLLVVHLLMMLGSAVAIYYYARTHLCRAAAVVSMIAYTILPYHLLDQYQRGAMAELLGFVWMPLIMLFTERLFNDRARRWADILGLAAPYGAFLWSHPPTAYQFSLALGLAVMVLTASSRDWRGLLRFGAGLAFGLCLAAAYLYPALRERDLIRHEYIEENWPYHDSYVFAKTAYAEAHRLFFDRIDHIWIFSVAAIVICGVVLIVSRRPVTGSSIKLRAVVLVVMGLLGCFLMTSPSQFMGRYIPKIEIGVFSWRMLSITTFAVAVLAGACAHVGLNRWRERRFAASIVLWVVTAAVVAGGATFTVLRVALPTSKVKAFEPDAEHLNFAIIPRDAPETPEELPEVALAELTAGNGDVQVEYWKPEQRALRVDLIEPDELAIRTFNFPGWTAYVNGQPTQVRTGEDLGDILIELPAGSHRVTLEYRSTQARKIGEIVTVIAMLVLIGLVVVSTSSRRKSGE